MPAEGHPHKPLIAHCGPATYLGEQFVAGIRIQISLGGNPEPAAEMVEKESGFDPVPLRNPGQPTGKDFAG